MDWQTTAVLMAVLAAAGFLVWRYLRRKAQPGACANCMAHQRLSMSKRPAAKD